MTGRDLIIYILQNGLEEEEVFKDGKFIGFMTANEAAAKYDVGISTIQVWVKEGLLDGVVPTGKLYIPKNAINPKERISNEKDNSNASGMPVRVSNDSGRGRTGNWYVC